MTLKVMGTDRGMCPLDTLLLQVRQGINNRNCRVRASKTLTEERLRKEVSEWKLPSKPRTPASPSGITIILFPCHVPKTTRTLLLPHIKRPEKGEVRIPTPVIHTQEQNETVLRAAGSK